MGTLDEVPEPDPLPPADLVVAADPPPADPPDPNLDADLALAINQQERLNQGLSATPRLTTRSGRTTKPPEAFQAGSSKAKGDPNRQQWQQDTLTSKNVFAERRFVGSDSY